MHNNGGRRGPQSLEKPKDIKKAFNKLLFYLHNFIPAIIVALILAALSSVFSIIGPNKLSDLTNVITDGLMTHIDLNKVFSICLLLLVLYLISAIFNYIQSFIMATVSNNFAKELRTKISSKINRLPLKYFDSNSYGDILSRVTNDVDTIGTSMYQSLGTLVSATTLFIGSIIMMFYTNWLMAITAIVSSTLGFILMFMILGKSQKYFLARQVELGKLNGHIEEIYSNHNVVKAYNGIKDATEKFDELNKSVFECNLKSQFLSG
jgi:ATP-binding cassette subfamily B protein